MMFDQGGASTKPFPLTALRHPGVSHLLSKQADLLADLANGLGSPLHVLLPEIFEENVRRMRGTVAELGIDAGILFAKKANKADCFVRSSARLGIGIDVASAPELAKALAGGIPGERIGISGPEKDSALHSVALQHGCLVAIDSLSELRRLSESARGMRKPARVLLRCRVDAQSRSRFGMAAAERNEAVSLCADAPESVRLEGFSFHLTGYSTQERAHAANEMIEHCVVARARGLAHCRLVDIGGGLPLRYVDPATWDGFLRQDAPDHYHMGKSFDGFYPYGTERPADLALRDIMKHPVDADETLMSKASRNDIGFLVEPGRALLDQAGFTIFGVQQVDDRRESDGYAIVTVHGSSFSLSEQWFNSEYLPDPVLIASEPVGNREFHASVAGSTCLESDMLTWRKIGFPRVVEPGDQLVYLNTAGYQMDSNESPFHEMPIPQKVVVRLGEEGNQPKWRLDGI
ncbi:diaminopimelate decarboxylase [Herbihabitans rhizosphaerae]|uniref:Diaminopimelate decarboxylase n=1 Tax=Herbihabitans rhizosphaerae TaxID=1872711 RepID=A0A4Q7KFG2_9PSEU|nr:alanine racemase [Herbihabitans rhizosphaerae]RZS32266.1 diaminopimelate decarboxylase [Herbihabitans rhizosphaerae]